MSEEIVGNCRGCKARKYMYYYDLCFDCYCKILGEHFEKNPYKAGQS